MIDRLAEPDRLLSVANALSEVAKLGEAASQIRARLDRRERGQAKTLTREIADQVFDVPAEEIDSRLVGPHDVVGQSQQHRGRDLETSVITSRRQSEGSLASFEGSLQIA